MSQRSILLADPDQTSTRQLGAALRARGHRVLTVRDGSKALEVAVMRVPDVILYDVRCPLLDPRVFSQILRANPRTASIPLVAMGPHDRADRIRGTGREAYIQKPFNVDEVLSRIEQLLNRAQAAEAMRRDGAIEGNLAQILLPDLLQVLSANRRSGILQVKSGEHVGQLALREGRILDARCEGTAGEKALYRILVWRDGTFSFAPGRPGGTPQIERTNMDFVLLEAMRHYDELGQLAGRAPAPGDELAVAVDLEHPPEGLHPVTREILGLIPSHRRTRQVVDHASSTDLEALRALTALVERGLVRVLGRVADKPGRRLVGPDVAYALHGRLAGPHSTSRIVRPEVAVVAESVGQLQALVAELGEVEGWQISRGRGAMDHGVGELGRMTLAETVELVLVALPASDTLAPLWRPVGGTCLGMLLLASGGPGDAKLVGPLKHFTEQNRPVMVVGSDELAKGGGRFGLKAAQAVEGLAQLMVRLVRDRAA